MSKSSPAGYTDLRVANAMIDQLEEEVARLAPPPSPGYVRGQARMRDRAAKELPVQYDGSADSYENARKLQAWLRSLPLEAASEGARPSPPRCDCCGHPPHDDRTLCEHPEPLWHEGRCHCAGSSKRPAAPAPSPSPAPEAKGKP